MGIIEPLFLSDVSASLDSVSVLTVLLTDVGGRAVVDESGQDGLCKSSCKGQSSRDITNCYDHALLVTGYDVLLSTLQGDLSFSTSSASSFASTHAGPDHFHL